MARQSHYGLAVLIKNIIIVLLANKRKKTSSDDRQNSSISIQGKGNDD